MYSSSRASGKDEGGSSSRSPRQPRSAKQGPPPRKAGGASAGSGSKTGAGGAGVGTGARSKTGAVVGSGSGSRSGLGLGPGCGSRSRSGSGPADTGGYKTLSMENVQSFSAAYTSSGPMYLSDRDPLGPADGYPRGTMTLGRNHNRTAVRTSYNDRATTMGSSPNINSTGPYVEHLQTGGPSGLSWQPGRGAPSSGTAGGGEGSMLELQAQLRNLERENQLLRRERDGREGGGTGGYARSPEGRRERRKEEGGLPSILKEQVRAGQDHAQQLQSRAADVQQDPRRDPQGVGRSPSPSAPAPAPRHSPGNAARQRHQLDVQGVAGWPGAPRGGAAPPPPCQVPGCDGSSSPSPSPSPSPDPAEENFIRLQAAHERQSRELLRLRQTLEDMELRTSDPQRKGTRGAGDESRDESALQRQTPQGTRDESALQRQTQTMPRGTRDESVQRLLEVLHGGGGGRARMSGVVSVAAEDVDHLEEENLHLREELHRRNQAQADPAKTKALQTVIDMKTTATPFCFDPDVIWQDTKISSLERNIRDLEDEVQMLKTSGLLLPEGRQDDMRNVELYKSHSRFMKTKVDQQKQDMKKRESDMQALQTKLETLANQNSDCKQHIEVLKESLNAKEQRSTILQTEVDALRVRLEEKESFLTKKSQQLQELTEEKGTLAGEARDQRDMLEVKERKIAVLQKKIENLLEQLKDRDKQLCGQRDRVTSLQRDSRNTETALSTLEEALTEKERVVERLREQKQRDERAHLEELEALRKENQGLKERLCSPGQPTTQAQPLTQALTQPQSQSQSLTQAQSQSQVLTQAQTTTMAVATQNTHQTQTPGGEVQSAEDLSRKPPSDLADRLRLLEQEVARYRAESGRSQAEVEKLAGALRETEADKMGKEMKIAELERQGHSPHVQKQTAAEKRKDGVTDGHPHSMSQEAVLTAERIRELEAALSDSMNTSVHREALWAQEEAVRTQAQMQLEELMCALERTRLELDSTKQRLSSTQNTLQERDGHLSSLRQERRKQLEEILEMKQQALLAAISEKDANIALLELSSSKRQKAQEEVTSLRREKDRLMYQLKQQTQSRMKLIADNYDEDHLHPHHHHPLHPHQRGAPRAPPPPPHGNHTPSVDQDDEEGIWA